MNCSQLHVLLIDDEPLSLEESAQKIAIYVPKEQISRASNSEETVSLLREKSFDVAFIDVEMPDTDGFMIASYISSNYPALKFVFLTGHTEMGAKSYDYAPLDFLSKPVDAIRLEKTFQRLLAARRPQRAQGPRIAVETTRGLALLSQAELFYIAKEGRKTVIYGRNDTYTVRYSLEQLAEIFHDFDLYRCHNSFLVSLSQISRIEQAEFGESFTVILTNGAILPLSRTRRPALKEILEQSGVQFH